jgi:VCBS repeat-containing protein
MKKLLSMLMLGMLVAPWTQAATVKISNLTASGNGAYGITNTEGALIGAGAGLGVIGRMTLSESEITDLLAEDDMQAVFNAFRPFGPTGRNTFALNNLGQDGVFEASLSQTTTSNDFGGSPIYVWLHTGTNRAAATNFILAKLSQNFPTDTQNPPETLEVFLRPEATFLAGANNGAPHDYQLPNGDVPQPTLKMSIQAPINQPPVAVAGTLSVARGQSATGTVTATDAESDALTFSVVTEPTKGTLLLAANGSYTYTSTAGTEGNDSFTFQANDGTSNSEPAEVLVTVSDTPPGPAVPSITITTLPSGFVGSLYEYQIPVANLPQGAATAYTAKGLPGGLKLDTKTGIITGYPTVAVTAKAVVLTARNAQGSSGNVPVTITIDPVPAGAVGTYVARVERNAGVGDLGGRLNLTTTTKGAVTAKLQVGTVAYTGKGRLSITEVSENPVVNVSIDFVKKGSPTLKATLVLDTAVNSTQDFQVTGSLINEATEGGTPAALSGVRNTWTKVVKADLFKGDYTYGLSLPSGSVGLESIPQGYGYGSLVINDKGVATFKGKTSDGKAFTVASIVGPQGHIPFFYSVAAVPGSLVSIPRVVVPETPSETVLNSLSGTVSWSKKAVPEKSKERAYRAGFAAPVDLALLGGLYRKPAAGGVVAGLPDNGTTNTQPNARLLFADGGLSEVVNVPAFDFTIMNKKDTGIVQTVVVAKPTKDPANNPNPNSITFKLVNKPAGYFSGTFTLPHETKSLVRKSTFEGSFVRHSDGSFERVGFFLLPELPEAGGKLNTTPLQSGSVEVEAVVPVTGL